MAEIPEQDTGVAGAAQAQPLTAGAKLRAAREAAGLSLSDVATRTRIAQRQLEAIERDDYAALPGIPYAVGFSRAYARAVDLNEVEIAADVRRAVHASDMGANRYEVFEPTDPARVPSRTLAWTAAAIAVIVIAGFTVWRTQILTPPTGEQIAQQQASPLSSPAKRAPAAVDPAAQTVVFTAIDDVWLRIYDDTGERLKDGLLKKGESFTLPTTARNPMILTGRPQSLTVTVGGKTVPPLGAADRTIADVPVSAGSLLARINAAPSAAPGTTGPAPSATTVGTSAAPSSSTRTEPRRSTPSRGPAASNTVPDTAPSSAPTPAQSTPAPSPSGGTPTGN